MGLCTKHGLHFFFHRRAIMSDNIDASILRFTVVGADALKTTLYIFRQLGINAIKRVNDPSKANEVNEGSFGNFRTKTYEMQLGTDELKPIMAERTRIANALAAESSLLVTAKQGNALELYIFDKRAFL